MAKQAVHLIKTSLFTYCGRPNGQVMDTHDIKRVTCKACLAAHGAQS